MSILRDLEPQHAKIHQSASPGTATKLAWMLAAILLLGGAAWLSFYLQQNVSTSDTAQPFTPSSQENRPRTPSTEVATATPSPATSEAAANPGAGVAVIREDTAAQASAKAAKSDSPNIFQTMQMELDKSRSDQVAMNAAPAAQAKKPAAKEEAPKNQAGKPASEGNKATKAATQSGSAASRPIKTDKRFAERDIEIITAIVK